MFVLGLLTQIFNLDREKLVGIIEHQFGAQDRRTSCATRCSPSTPATPIQIGEIFGQRDYEFQRGKRATSTG